MPRRIARADRVQRVVPGLEDFAGGGIEVVAGILIPRFPVNRTVSAAGHQTWW